MIKFPKTQRVTPDVPEEWMKFHVTVEEKIDGANAGISFNDGILQLQSRGKILTPPIQGLFQQFPGWAYEKMHHLQKCLGERYILFGEWVFAKGKVYYDKLPDRFIAFDMWDKEKEFFLAPKVWRDMVPHTISKSPILWTGPFKSAPPFSSLIRDSEFKSFNWRSRLQVDLVTEVGIYYGEDEFDWSNQMEGVYIKVDDGKQVVGRMKLPREDFEKVKTDDNKWGRRPLFLNRIDQSYKP